MFHCVESILRMELKNFTDIYIMYPKGVDNTWESIRSMLYTQLVDGIRQVAPGASINIHIDTCDEFTESESDTVCTMIERNGIRGPIFIKDTDNSCMIKNIKPENAVTVFPIEQLNIVDPRHKSYVKVNENIVTNIIEKRVVSNLFCSGGYSFESAADFIDAYAVLRNIIAPDIENSEAHVYISNIIYYLMLMKEKVFVPIYTSGFIDYKMDRACINYLYG